MDLICKKYNNHNPRKPILKTNNYLYLIFLPFEILDCILYKLKLKPITDYVNPIILLIIYFVIIIIVVIYLIKRINFKKLLHPRIIT